MERKARPLNNAVARVDVLEDETEREREVRDAKGKRKCVREFGSGAPQKLDSEKKTNTGASRRRLNYFRKPVFLTSQHARSQYVANPFLRDWEHDYVVIVHYW